MSSQTSKTSDPHRLLLSLTDKITLRARDKYVALSNLSISYTWKDTKKSYKNNGWIIPDGSYSVSDIQDYFKHILKNMRQLLIIIQ